MLEEEFPQLEQEPVDLAREEEEQEDKEEEIHEIIKKPK